MLKRDNNLLIQSPAFLQMKVALETVCFWSVAGWSVNEKGLVKKEHLQDVSCKQ